VLLLLVHALLVPAAATVAAIFVLVLAAAACTCCCCLCLLLLKMFGSVKILTTGEDSIVVLKNSEFYS